MKRILALGISTILVLPIMSTVAVLAEDTQTTTNGSPGTSTTNKPETKPPVATTTTPPSSNDSNDDPKAMQARLEKHKSELKIKLTSDERLNIQTKCKPAQGPVGTIKERVKGIETSRSEAYANIVSHLTDLSTKLKNKGADTKALDADIVALQAKITSFNTDLAAYKQAVSDVVAMDCKTDPEGFKAALLTARTDLETVNKDAQAIRGYINDTIKPELKKIRDSLNTSKPEGNQ